MAGRTEIDYPPCEGTEPYIHLCFSDRDERKVRPLLRRLLLRGCRVWYAVGDTPDRDVHLARSQRMLGAGLTVLFLTEAVRADTRLKNRLLVCQKAKQPILDGGDRGLSLGLTGENAVSVPADRWLGHVMDKEIHMLSCHRCKISNEQLRAFAEAHPMLEQLTLSWNPQLTDLSCLLTLPHLREVRVSGDMHKAIASLGDRFGFALKIE